MQQPIFVQPEFQCAISNQIMIDPVTLVVTGQMYEREEIETWLANNDTCPMTKAVLNGNKTTTSIPVFKTMISSFLQQNPILWEDNNPTGHTVYESEKLKQQLITALETDDANNVSIFLSKDPRFLKEDKDIKDKKNLLMLACEKASLNILRISINKIQSSPYPWVTKIREYPLVKKDNGLSLFLTVAHKLGFEGAQLMAETLGWEQSDFQKLLDYAIENNDIQIAEIALRFGSVATEKLLNKAYSTKSTEMAKVLLSAGAPIDIEDNQGNDLLMISIKEGYTEISLFLILNLSDQIHPNKLNESGESALHIAVQTKNANVINALCKHPKIDINQPKSNGDTALHIAVKNRDLNTAKLLVQHKADMDIKTSDTGNKKTASEIADQNNDIDMQKFLILLGAKIDDLLLKAISEDKKGLIQFLLTEAIQFVNPNIAGSGGKTALMLAAEKKQTETISLLLNHPKINIYQTDSDGNKALHYAAEGNHQEGVKMLMKKGSSIKDKNCSQKTPLQLAQEKGFQALSVWMEGKHRAKKIKPFLKPLKLEIESQKEKLTEQEKTIKNQQVKIAELEKSQKEMILTKERKILKKQEQERVYQQARDRQRQEEIRREKIRLKKDPFVAALLKGDIETAKKLESEGASLTAHNTEGIYPLAAAVYSCNLELVRYIEGKLKDKATEQWAKVDPIKANESINSQMPTELPINSTYRQLGKWYIKHNGMSWCGVYDREALKKMGKKKWNISWRGNGWDDDSKVNVYACWDWRKKIWNEGLASDWDKEDSGVLYAPSFKVHQDVVMSIRQQLDELKYDVSTKAKKSLSVQKFA